MSDSPAQRPSSRWVGLFTLLRPYLICAGLFWLTPYELATVVSLLDHGVAY